MTLFCKWGMRREWLVKRGCDTTWYVKRLRRNSTRTFLVRERTSNEGSWLLSSTNLYLTSKFEGGVLRQGWWSLIFTFWRSLWPWSWPWWEWVDDEISSISLQFVDFCFWVELLLQDDGTEMCWHRGHSRRVWQEFFHWPKSRH